MSRKEHKCGICVKTYSSYKTLWTHNKKFHNSTKNEIIIEKTPAITPPIIRFVCKNCKKEYKHVQSKNKHEKSCLYVPQISAELELEKARQETIKLKIELQKMKNLDEKTIKSINKIIKDRDKTNITNITNNNNNTQNININFPNILGFGSEDALNILSQQDKIIIIESFYNSLDKIVEMVHCGKYDACKNIIITNLNTGYGYKYDDSEKCFVSADKSKILNDLYDNRMKDLKNIYETFSKEKMINEHSKYKFKKFLNELTNSGNPYTDKSGKKYDNFKSSKINDIKLLLYNNRDKLIEDISAFVCEESDPLKTIA